MLLQGPTGIGRRGVAVKAALRAGLVPIGLQRPAAELKLLARLGAAVPVVPAEAVAELGWTPEDGPLIAWGPADPREWDAYVVALAPPRYEQRWARASHSPRLTSRRSPGGLRSMRRGTSGRSTDRSYGRPRAASPSTCSSGWPP